MMGFQEFETETLSPLKTFSGSHTASFLTPFTGQSKSEGTLDIKGRADRPHLMLGKAAYTHKMGGTLPSWPQALRLLFLLPVHVVLASVFLCKSVHSSSAPSSKKLP